jgi:hypothetical protein
MCYEQIKIDTITLRSLLAVSQFTCYTEINEKTAVVLRFVCSARLIWLSFLYFLFISILWPVVDHLHSPPRRPRYVI